MKFKKILIVLFWIAALAGIVTMIVYAGSRYDNVAYKGYSINITASDDTERLISKSDIENIILTRTDSLIGRKFKDIDLVNLEKTLRENVYVNEAEISGDMWGNLQINVKQRKPIARIVNKENEQYYIDDLGGAMPIRPGMPARVIVVNGNISTKYSDFRADTVIQEINAILSCMNAINRDEFLKAQIGQVFIDDNNDFILIPLLGDHTVLLGSPYFADNRLENLKIFYKEGLGVEEWKKSKRIDIRFENQVVVQNKNR